MAKFGVGQSPKRVEDQRLITGNGRFTDDIKPDGQLSSYVLRSPHANARIVSIDIAAAKSAPGVHGVWSAAEMDPDRRMVVPCFIPLQNKDGSNRADPAHPILCHDRVAYVGDNVAFVVADTLAQARDAAELIEVEYDVLPSVSDTRTATDPGQPLAHPDVPNNKAFDWHYGQEDKVKDAFASAAHVTTLELINNRVVCNAMEPRAAVAEFDAASGKLTVHTCTQGGSAFECASRQSRPRGGKSAGHHPRCRRRSWHEGDVLSRIHHGRLRRDQARQTGEMEQRPLGRLPLRQHGPRSCHQGRAGLRCQ